MLGALSALAPLSIDTSLPALPVMARDLRAPDWMMQATLGGFMLAFALGQLVYGPLSDRWGRRPAIALGLTIYAIGGVACTLTPNAAVLICARIVEGFGACAGATVTRAIVRDLIPELRAAASLQAYITVAVSVAPIVAPLIGAAILPLGWRAIYAFLVLCGVTLLILTLVAQPETLTQRSSSHPIAAYLTFLRLPTAVPLALLITFAFGAYFSFISGSPFVLQHQLGLTSTQFAFAFALNATALVIGSYGGGRAAHAVEPRHLVIAGTLGMSAAGLACASLATGMTPALFVAVFALFAFCYGLAVPQAYAVGLFRAPQIAGTASAGLGAGQQLGGSIGSTVVGVLPFVPSVSVGICAAAGGVLAAASGLWFRRREKRESS